MSGRQYRRPQVEKVKAGRRAYVEAQEGSRDDRILAACELNTAVEEATPDEVTQAYQEHWLS